MASSWVKPLTYQRGSSGGGRIRTTSKAKEEAKAGYKNGVRKRKQKTKNLMVHFFSAAPGSLFQR
jgi:hypothetical protein